MSANAIRNELLALADKENAQLSQRFFKCGKGQYAEGDIFIGVTVPAMRSVAKRHGNATKKDVEALLKDPVHECRFLALILLVALFRKADEEEKQALYDFYVRHLRHVNNWDLVDSSAYQIVGVHLRSGDRSALDSLAQSSHLWTQRVAIVSTFAFIQEGQTADTFRIADLLLSHSHDLMHKAVGWMLREAGKRDASGLRRFLQTRYDHMPRTMLRYAIEKFPETERKRYLEGKI